MKRRLTSVMLLTISPGAFTMDKESAEKDTEITEFYCCRHEKEGEETKLSVMCYEEDNKQDGERHQINYDTSYENTLDKNADKNENKFTYERRRLKEALEEFKKLSFKKVILRERTREDGSKYWEEESLEGL